MKLIAISDQLYNSAISLFPKQNAMIQRALPPENTEFLEELKANWVKWDYKVYSTSKEKILKGKLNIREWFGKAVNGKIFE